MLFTAFGLSLPAILALSQPAACAKWFRDADELKFHVRSSNPATNNRILSLRPNPNNNGFLPGTFYHVGLDNTSPQLLAHMMSGALYSNAYETLNHGGYLELQGGPGDGQTLRFLFSFANFTRYPSAADTDWTLTASSGGLQLHHNQPHGAKGGFALCEAKPNHVSGPWYELTYFWSDGQPAQLDGCEFVNIVSTQAQHKG
ncbi:hypothetical protein EsDP_00007233 [Epichloe bromicola]|uniref:Uncharacterized protein n=1 Tax=Epichloe bromicola TaxID=79588 RepID=A0ABQ0CZY7_9HYPO